MSDHLQSARLAEPARRAGCHTAVRALNTYYATA
jgi:hypothetical protein